MATAVPLNPPAESALDLNNFTAKKTAMSGQGSLSFQFHFPLGFPFLQVSLSTGFYFPLGFTFLLVSLSFRIPFPL